KDHISQKRKQDIDWKKGRSFCLVYYPGEERYNKIKEIFNLYFSDNALNPTATPSLVQLEAEALSMCSDLFNGGDDARGTITSGGTESIMLAMKTAKRWAKRERPNVKQPEMVICASAHPAFMKGCDHFDIKGVFVKPGADGRADVEAMRAAVNENTIMMVASAPSYPYGLVDPIEDLGKVALDKDILFHVDACIGGFMLPFVKELGYDIPKWDFSVPGVTSISADMHKYGYSSKGSSVVIYRNAQLRKHQFSVYTGWIGGIYGSPTITGTRPGGTIAGAWAAFTAIGKDGYMEMAEATMKATDTIKKGVESIDELEIIGDPDMTILAFKSAKINIFELADELNKRGWHFERQQNPPSIHLTINYIHRDFAEEFLADLRAAVEVVKKFKISQITNKIQIGIVKGLSMVLPEGSIAKIQSKQKASTSNENSAAMYGMMGALADTGDLKEIVVDFLDKINSLESK
ncbi:MAG: aspartate aminotransferase family protein, partial [Flavobacteriales bacterium]|nr:aspartate aminotransferase family protein [Flavobacteriales bacterium]